MNRYARLLLQLCRVRVAHNDVAQSGSIEKLRRRRVTFIEHRLDKETSSIRSDMFVLMPLLTELHSEGELHAINTARLRRSCGRASVRRVRRARRAVTTDQTAKLSPQEQCATAFGLVTLKPPFCRSSL